MSGSVTIVPTPLTQIPACCPPAIPVAVLPAKSVKPLTTPTGASIGKVVELGAAGSSLLQAAAKARTAIRDSPRNTRGKWKRYMMMSPAIFLGGVPFKEKDVSRRH
jgi:hypothetical protein